MLGAVTVKSFVDDTSVLPPTVTFASPNTLMLTLPPT